MSNAYKNSYMAPMYQRWKNMRELRGDEWAAFLDFVADMGLPTPGQVLVRIDRSKPFCLDNCEWVDEKEYKNGESNPNFKGRLITGECLVCGAPIKYYQSQEGRKYCSRECRAAHDKKAQRCLVCGKSFIPDSNGSVYHCSSECADLAKIYKEEAAKRNLLRKTATQDHIGAPKKKRFLRFCKICGEKMYLRESDINKGRKFCSRKCYGLSVGLRQQGDKHHNWKGGVTVVRDVGRKHPLYAKWREKVFTRDDFTCQSCFAKGGDIRAHHMVFYKDSPKKRFKLSNGITLCAECHRLWHIFDRKGVFEGLEKNLQKKGNEKFKEAGFFVFNVHGGGYQVSGTPDAIMCFCGMFVAVEYKVFPNFVTPLQKAQINSIKNSGGRAYMVNSEDDVDRIISEMREAALGTL